MSPSTLNQRAQPCMQQRLVCHPRRPSTPLPSPPFPAAATRQGEGRGADSTVKYWVNLNQRDRAVDGAGMSGSNVGLSLFACASVWDEAEAEICITWRKNVGKSVTGNWKLKPVTGNFTGNRFTGNRITTLVVELLIELGMYCPTLSHLARVRPGQLLKSAWSSGQSRNWREFDELVFSHTAICQMKLVAAIMLSAAIKRQYSSVSQSVSVISLCLNCADTD